MKIKKLALIPAYMPTQAMLPMLDELKENGFESIVVNDGSGNVFDDYFDKARQKATVIDHPRNFGKGVALRTGLTYISTHYAPPYVTVTLDADGQHLPETLPVMIEAMERERADIVIGSRALAGESEPEGLRGAGSKFIAGIMRLTTGTRITDPTSGLRLYSLRAIEVFAKAFDLAPEPDAVALLARKGYKVVEVPARMQERQGGTSYLDLPNIVRYMLRTCFSILMFQWFR
jgi:glycosyltransferase involved in cell wall biosynthesis